MNRTITIEINDDDPDGRILTATWDANGFPESYHYWIERLEEEDEDGNHYRDCDDSDADPSYFTTLEEAQTAFFASINFQVGIDRDKNA